MSSCDEIWEGEADEAADAAAAVRAGRCCWRGWFGNSSYQP
jgi:hypothetical protein